MVAEIKEFHLTTPDFVISFGLGSAEPVKKWSRFKVTKSGDLYWTHAINIRRDIDRTDTHTSIHKSGAIVSSRYQGSKKVRAHFGNGIGASFQEIKKPYKVLSGNERFEHGYLYHGLVTLTDNDKRQSIKKLLIPCLDENLVNSKLDYSFYLLPWVISEKVTEYVIKQNQAFEVEDSRSHLFIFCCGGISLAVSIKFTEGDGPIDNQCVIEADKDIHPLKRLFHEDTIIISDAAR